MMFVIDCNNDCAHCDTAADGDADEDRVSDSDGEDNGEDDEDDDDDDDGGEDSGGPEHTRKSTTTDASQGVEFYAFTTPHEDTIQASCRTTADQPWTGSCFSSRSLLHASVLVTVYAFHCGDGCGMCATRSGYPILPIQERP